MRQHLKKVMKSVDEKLYLAESIVKNYPGMHEYEKKPKEDLEVELLLRKSMLADFYLMKKELESLLRYFNSTLQDCISELKDTYYEDRVARWVDVGIPYEPEKDNPFANIRSKSEEGCFEMSKDLKDYIEKFPMLEMALSEGLFNIVPDGSIAKIDHEGNLQSMSKDQALHHGLQKDMKAQMSIQEHYDLTIKKLLHLAEKKGSLSDIIKLVE